MSGFPNIRCADWFKRCREFLFYCRDKPNVTSLLERLAEARIDGAQLTGFAAVLQSPDRAAAIALLTDAFTGSAHDLHRWCIGGCR
jgi:hypothetical protein